VPTDWILMRGLVREQRHWGAFPEILARELGVRAHTIDLPGTGTQHGETCPSSVRGIAEDVRARWLGLRALTERAHGATTWGLLGVSLGGMVSMAWASAHPGDFERVVLANTSASNAGMPWDRMKPRALLGVARSFFARDLVERERIVLDTTVRLLPAEERDALARRWAEYAAEAPVARATLGRQLFAATTFRAPPRIEAPTLVIIGGQDPLAAPACGRALAARFGAPIELHPTAGHDIGTDAPEWFAARVRAWLLASAA
jgi:pimeloyl-ACP methyl ester carboxylesterase